MALRDVEIEILEPMQRLYLPPRNMDEGQQKLALREYGNALQSFEASDLRVAWSTVRDTHTTRSWPVPAAFVMAARGARKERSDELRWAKAPKFKDDAWETWLKVRGFPVAFEAMKLGVAWAFRCAILDKKQVESIDLRALRYGKDSAERSAERLEAGEINLPEEHRKTALDMWHTLKIREEQTADEIRRNQGAA